MSISDPAFEQARKARCRDEWAKEAAYIGGGGSIPIAGYFKEILGMDAMLIGFGQRRRPDPFAEREIRRRRAFHKGIRSWARILAALR